MDHVQPCRRSGMTKSVTCQLIEVQLPAYFGSGYVHAYMVTCYMNQRYLSYASKWLTLFFSWPTSLTRPKMTFFFQNWCRFLGINEWVTQSLWLHLPISFQCCCFILARPRGPYSVPRDGDRISLHVPLLWRVLISCMKVASYSPWLYELISSYMLQYRMNVISCVISVSCPCSRVLGLFQDSLVFPSFLVRLCLAHSHSFEIVWCGLDHLFRASLT
jgi:hypothetical protein